MPPLSHQDQATSFFKDLQDRICAALEESDGTGRFREDLWQREGGGGGRTRVLADGAVFEKAGVNFSEVFGKMSPDFAAHVPGEGLDFTATGISLVLHPRSPLVPTVHANFRFLTKGTLTPGPSPTGRGVAGEGSSASGRGVWGEGSKQWFGGGADLTPYYPCREDVIHFHRTWQAVCKRHPAPVDYPRFKKWCDEYFFLAHRNECRGVGGIFFDYLDGDFKSLFAFIQDCGNSFLDGYLPIVRRRKSEVWTDRQRAFQEFRRGRYVEFNLIYDRGTLFGLKTGGRTESILMSLPPVVRWDYDYQPQPGSPEAEIYAYLKPRDWAAEQP